MWQRTSEISDKLKQFIDHQKIFFVATATAGGRVNLSPKGNDSLRVVDKNRVVWLNASGSGNETSAHILENPRMTIISSFRFERYQRNSIMTESELLAWNLASMTFLFRQGGGYETASEVWR